MSDRIYSIPEYCKEIMDMLQRRGYSVFVAGGAVRDLILGKEPHDYDMASSARPEEVIAAAEEEGYRMIIETGIKHGTVTLLSHGQPIEITTFRTDGDYEDSRHPSNVEFSLNIEEDVKRRDFTMNALYLDRDGRVRDLVGGVEDIKNGIVRAVGDPVRRFSEDALRIMRALRFASVMDLKIDEKTSEAMILCKDLLRKISAERINKEFSDMICGNAAVRIIRENVDVLSVIIPELKEMEGFDQRSDYHDLDMLEHTLAVLENIPVDEQTGKRDLILSYAALLHDIGKPKAFTVDEDGKGHMKQHERIGYEITLDLAERLKFSNDLKKNVSELVLLHDEFVEPAREAVHKFMTEHSPDFIERLAILQRADIAAHSPLGRTRIRQLEAIKEIRERLISDKIPLSVKDLAISGQDLIKLGFPEGPMIGSVLNDIFHEVVSGNLDNDCELIFTFVARKYR